MSATPNQSPDAFLALHMPTHSNTRKIAHDFLAHELGMGGILPPERLAVLPNGTFGMDDGGSYYPALSAAFVVDKGTNKPVSDNVRRVTAIAHEFAHSATVDDGALYGEHPYFIEALAGFAEYKLLRRLEELGHFQTPREIGWISLRGSNLYVPASVRKVDRREDTEPISPDMKVNSTNGLIAAISIGPGLAKTGIKSGHILQGDGPSSRRFDQLKEAIESIKPGLVEEIEQIGRSPDSVYKAASLVQKTVLKKAANTH